MKSGARRIWRRTDSKEKHRDLRGEREEEKERKEEKTNKFWCRIFPLMKMIHNDSASFFSSLFFFFLSLKDNSSCLECVVKLGPPPSLSRLTHCLSSVCPV